MEYLSAGDILAIHSAMIEETGGSHGVRELPSLHALQELPKQSAFGKELYPSVYDKGAVYARNIIYSHPFMDGNKRTAMAAADVFLQLNGYRIVVSKGGVEKFALEILSKHLELPEITAWLKKHSKRVKHK